MFKKIVEKKVYIAAKILLLRKKPEIVAITGSAGKTTTAKLVNELLSLDFDVLSSAKGYNTELGAPLSLFGLQAPVKTKSIPAWIKIIATCYKKAFSMKDYPEKVVVEMGADAPGDIKYLAKLFKPQRGVVLTVLPTHLAEFSDVSDIAKEKGMLALGVSRGGRVFLNCDDMIVKDMEVSKGAEKVFFGTHKGCDVGAENIKSDLTGISFDLVEGKEKTSIKTMLYGDQMIYPILASIAVARADHISTSKIKKAFLGIKPMNGRMNVLEGIRESIIIDDSYNSSPEPALKALDFLGRQKGRRIAVLGSMNELGDYEKRGHEIVGKKASEVADIIVTVGEVAEKYLAESVVASGFDENKLFSFLSSKEAGQYVKGIIKKGDIVLCKGSQNNVRVEKVVEQIILNKNAKKDLLVRQSEFWKQQD